MLKKIGGEEYVFAWCRIRDVFQKEKLIAPAGCAKANLMIQFLVRIKDGSYPLNNN